jgi:hypothetical protein
MNNGEISDLLLVCVAVAWFAKIWFHFRYFKVTYEELKSSNFVSFFTSSENIFKIIRVVMPIFFGTKTRNEVDTGMQKKKVWVCTCLLWLTLAVSFFYLYNHPSSNEIQKVEYDLTKSPNN